MKALFVWLLYVTCQVVYTVCVLYSLYALYTQFMHVHYTVYVCCTCLYVCTRVCKVFSRQLSYIGLVYRKPTDNMPDYSSTIIGGKMSE